MISEIPLACPHCRQSSVKPVSWLQQNTFYTCEFCDMPVMIDKDGCAEVVAKLELQQQE
ncbi:MAG TPA: hypothetical protein VN668_02855 [Stellaceae bacterium]|nr:hypothetical protein [Stellaceae bacterium]